VKAIRTRPFFVELFYLFIIIGLAPCGNVLAEHHQNKNAFHIIRFEVKVEKITDE
jgi:hypothetical protein